MKKVLIVVALLVATLAALPFYSGYRVEQELQKVVDAVNDYPGYEASLEDYSKGWLSSSGTLKINFTVVAPGNTGATPEPEDLGLPVEFNVDHGPLLFNDIATVGWFSYRSSISQELLNSANSNDGQFTLIDAEHLMFGSGYANLAGDMQFNSEIAKFNYADQSSDVEFNVDFGGASGNGSLARNGLIDFDLAIGSLKFKNSKEDYITVASSTLAGSGDYSKVVSNSLYPSEFVFIIPKVDGRVEGKPLLFEKFTMAAEITFSEADPVFSMLMDASLAKGSVDGQEVSDADLSISYDNISFAIYDSYMKYTEAMLQDPASQPDFTQLFSEEDIKEALIYNPGFSIHNLQATVPDGNLQGSMKVAIQPLQDFDLATVFQKPEVLINMTTVNLNMSGDKPLVHKMMEPKIRQDIEVQLAVLEAQGQPQNMTLEEVDNLVETSVVATIQQLSQQGLVVEENDQYVTSFSLIAGNAKVNGVDFPLDALMGGIKQ